MPWFPGSAQLISARILPWPAALNSASVATTVPLFAQLLLRYATGSLTTKQIGPEDQAAVAVQAGYHPSGMKKGSW